MIRDITTQARGADHFGSTAGLMGGGGGATVGAERGGSTLMAGLFFF